MFLILCFHISYICPSLLLIAFLGSRSSNLYAAYTRFEKQHGAQLILESTVLGKQHIQYEDEVAHNGCNYDAWFDYARLVEGAL